MSLVESVQAAAPFDLTVAFAVVATLALVVFVAITVYITFALHGTSVDLVEIVSENAEDSAGAQRAD